MNDDINSTAPAGNAEWDASWDQWLTGAAIVAVTLFAYGWMHGLAHVARSVAGGAL